MKLTKELFETSLNYELYKKIIILCSIQIIILFLITFLSIIESINVFFILLTFFIIPDIILLCIIYHFITKIKKCYKYIDSFKFYNVTLTKFQHGGFRDTFYSEIELYNGLTVETDNFWVGEYSFAARNIEDYINKELTIAYSEEANKVVVFDGILD